MPLVREGSPVGVSPCGDREVEPFSETEIGLVQTFANRRSSRSRTCELFQELQSRNARAGGVPGAADGDERTAQDDRPVHVRSPAGLRDAGRECSEAVRSEAVQRLSLRRSPLASRGYPRRLHLRPQRSSRRIRSPPDASRRSAPRCPRTTHTFHIHDVAGRRRVPLWAGSGALAPHRTGMPMLRAGDLWGRSSSADEVLPFTDSQIALMKTFADQAAIAIENVRLFKELQARTTQLTRSVERADSARRDRPDLSSTLDLGDHARQTIVDPSQPARRGRRLLRSTSSTMRPTPSTSRPPTNLDEAATLSAPAHADPTGEGVVGPMAQCPRTRSDPRHRRRRTPTGPLRERPAPGRDPRDPRRAAAPGGMR